MAMERVGGGHGGDLRVAVPKPRVGTGKSSHGIPPGWKELGFFFPVGSYLCYNLSCSVLSLSLTLQTLLQTHFAAPFSQ